ncbi:MAG: DUF1648 domain-containing protein [bacterium]
MSIKRLFPLFVIVLSFAIGAYFYPQMPSQIVSHWNESGVADGYMQKFWGIFLVPFILVFLYLLFQILPSIDPKKQNLKDFRGSFDNFINIFFVFMFGVYLFTISWNLGYKYDIMRFFSIGFAFFIYSLGVLVERAKMNWFIGIRTPWTLSSEKVWNDTHRVGGRVYKIAALLSLFGVLAGQYAIFFVMLPLIGVSFYLVIFSYFDFKNQQK